jgi:hypothetical protein
VGKANDFLLDDKEWVVRYLVADTGGWLTGRRVLVSPYLLGDPDLGRINSDSPVGLTQSRIEECPPLDKQAPVSRRYELEMAKYYSYPAYWSAGVEHWGVGAHPVAPLQFSKEHLDGIEAIEDCHLRSVAEVLGYHVRASDDEIGHLEDFIVECDTWVTRYLIIDTRNWLPGKKVLISPAWLYEVDWHERKVHAAMTCDAIKGSPEFNPSSPVNRDYEGRLYDYYGLPRYW